MIIPDVNLLIYAHREDSAHHRQSHEWLTSIINGSHTYGISELVLSAFVRIVTHPKIFVSPSRLEEALLFVNQLRKQPNAVVLAPGTRHWEIFERLCREVGAKGNMIPDAYFAALAIEHNSEWMTTDRDYSRFPGLKWTNPITHII